MRALFHLGGQHLRSREPREGTGRGALMLLSGTPGQSAPKDAEGCVESFVLLGSCGLESTLWDYLALI